MNEVRKHEGEIERLCNRMAEHEAEKRATDAKQLLLDAARKAEVTRSEDRVKRIGLILANGLVQPKVTDADELEEMMRVAMELSDRDIEFLGELIRIEGNILEGADHIGLYTAHAAWERGRWGTRVDPELDSVFSKLESYGLVARIPPPNNLNITADFQNRYVLLKKGQRFAHLIAQA